MAIDVAGLVGRRAEPLSTTSASTASLPARRPA